MRTYFWVTILYKYHDVVLINQVLYNSLVATFSFGFFFERQKKGFFPGLTPLSSLVDTFFLIFFELVLKEFSDTAKDLISSKEKLSIYSTTKHKNTQNLMEWFYIQWIHF